MTFIICIIQLCLQQENTENRSGQDRRLAHLPKLHVEQVTPLVDRQSVQLAQQPAAEIALPASYEVNDTLLQMMAEALKAKTEAYGHFLHELTHFESVSDTQPCYTSFISRERENVERKSRGVVYFSMSY